MPVFDFRDASLKGDPRWSQTSKFTSLAPPLILLLLLLSITQIILGAIYITTIQSATTNLTFAQVLQPLIVPALSFFNTIPSLHLHVLARSNKPVLAMVFSSILAVLYLVSAVVFLPACMHEHRAREGGYYNVDDGGFAETECPAGSRRDVWIGVVVLQFLSALGYMVHFAMAFWVRRALNKRERDEREGRVMVVIDPVEKAKREEEARQRWREIRDL